MNENEKKSFYIATCKCCLLAETMKTCEECRFKVGLATKPETIQKIPVSIPAPAIFFAFSEQSLS